METTKPTFAAAQPDAARATLFRNVYLWMTMALALTALTAYTVAGSETLLQAIFSSRFVFLGLIVAGACRNEGQIAAAVVLELCKDLKLIFLAVFVGDADEIVAILLLHTFPPYCLLSCSYSNPKPI